MRRPLLLVALIVSAAVVTVAATLLPSSFLGAGPGAAVSFQAVTLPRTSAGPSAPAGPGLLAALSIKSAFAPTLHQLLEGETVITTDAQMKEVWRRLFAEPYDAAQFDFSQTFVVLMGGGAIANGSFEISAVEEVQADYAPPDGGGRQSPIEHLLSVTATTFLSGVQPIEPPPVLWRLSAVKIPREQLDDVVFHRDVIMGI